MKLRNVAIALMVLCLASGMALAQEEEAAGYALGARLMDGQVRVTGFLTLPEAEVQALLDARGMAGAARWPEAEGLQPEAYRLIRTFMADGFAAAEAQLGEVTRYDEKARDTYAMWEGLPEKVFEGFDGVKVVYVDVAGNRMDLDVYWGWPEGRGAFADAGLMNPQAMETGNGFVLRGHEAPVGEVASASVLFAQRGDLEDLEAGETDVVVYQLSSGDFGLETLLEVVEGM